MVKNKQKYDHKKSKPKSSSRWIYIGMGSLLLVAMLLALALVPKSSGGPLGQEVTITSRDHIPETQDPSQYYTNPPAGGPHFPDTFQARFYQESDLPSLPKYPQGYLVHNLEHGYVIFWYNCQASPSINCADLKQQIQSVMAAYGGIKLIAFPWSALDTPLALTSWGRILKMTTLDVQVMRQFVDRNRNQAPEPDTP